MLEKLNTEIFLLINATPNTSKPMISLPIFCAKYLIYAPVIVIFVCRFKKPMARDLMLKIIIITLVALIIATIFRIFIHSPRPFDLSIGSNFLLHSSSNSFPSKRSVFIFAITFALFGYSTVSTTQKYIFAISLFIAVAISWSRIYLGVYWPLDIIAGVLVSALSVYLVQRNWLNLFRLATRMTTSLLIIVTKIKTFKQIIENSN